jgi:hypothetical protein
MTDKQITRWIKDHLVEFTQPVDDMRKAEFRFHGELFEIPIPEDLWQELFEIPIPEDLWQYCLNDYRQMDNLRRAVMKRVIHEREVQNERNHNQFKYQKALPGLQ